MPEHLALVFDAPMMAFGGETIDNHGVVRDFPARSMITGLIANALGWDRAEGALHDDLQARIDHAAARTQAGARIQDYQTARLFEKDAGWTTHGRVEGRASSPSFGWDALYEVERDVRAKSLTHQRYRDFDADAKIVVAMRLASKDRSPNLDDVERALLRPERPLFLGRKPFLPSGWIAQSRIEAETPLHALARVLDAANAPQRARVQWDPDECDIVGERRTLSERWELGIEHRGRVADLRRYAAGVHGGSRSVAEGTIRLQDREQ